MKTIILSFALIFLSSMVWATEYSTVGRLHKNGDSLELIRSNEGDVINYLLASPEIKLKSGEEAIFRGYVRQDITHRDGKSFFRPVLIIQSVTPVSLQLIGSAAHAPMEFADPDLNFKPHTYGHNSFPVTTEVASAITLTSTVLLMQSLTANPAEPHTKQQLNSGVVIFAGTLATLMFIMDQLQDSKK